MEEQIIYNPAWFQPDQSGFGEIADFITQASAEQPQPQQPTTQTDNNIDKEEFESLFETMNSLLSEMKAAKQVSNELSAPRRSDDEDFALFESLFNDDNTPIDWYNVEEARSAAFHLPKDKVAQTIYQQVLSQTGDEKRAQNAVKIAQHESGFRPNATNQYNMAGLFQFSPANQRKYNISTNSPVEAQTKAWLQYLSDNNIPVGQEGVGQLAPGYIGRDVIYKRGNPAYEANKTLDLNNDGLMTAAEINSWFKVQ